MKIAGEYTFQMSRDEVWQGLLDPEVLQGTLPGCEELRLLGENKYAGRLKMKVGPVQGVFEGEVEIKNPVPPESYELVLKGKGAPGFVNGNGRLELEETDEGTLLRYDIDAQVGGRIAAVGQRLLQSSAKVITKQGLSGLEKQLEQRVARGAEDEAASPEPAGDDSADEDADPDVPTEEPELVDPHEAPTVHVSALEPPTVPPSEEPTPEEHALAAPGERALTPGTQRNSLGTWIVGTILVALALVAVFLRGCS